MRWTGTLGSAAVLALTLRQGLESAELADVLGVSTNNAYVMVNRMKKTLEESVAALMLFRDRRHCEQLSTLLSTHEVAGLSPDTRRHSAPILVLIAPNRGRSSTRAPYPLAGTRWSRVRVAVLRSAEIAANWLSKRRSWT